MSEKNRFFLLTGLLTFISALMFNNLYASDFLIDTTRNMIDTTSGHFNELYQSNHFFELATLLPFHNEYLLWDTTTIHPYNFDLTKMQDTVTLILADNSDCAFIAPIAGFVTSNFGARSHTRYHYGIDLKVNVGDTVRAAFDGVIRISEYNHGGYGNVVVIRHYNGLETLYGHMSARNVVCGQTVRAGDVVGLGGNTGHSSGPHLHFETRYKGKAIDPSTIINFNDPEGYSLVSDTLSLSHSDFNYLVKFKAAAAHSRFYTIRRGDTLSSIAYKNKTTVNRLCQLNRMSRNAVLHPGKKIKLR